jgi:putative lipoic acid-binding regulatory protein
MDIHRKYTWRNLFVTENGMSEFKNQKPVVEYPCLWGYKVIGPDEDNMRQAVKHCLDECLQQNTGDREYELGQSRTSKGGKYISLSLNLTVNDEAERDSIFTSLSARTEILMVI